MGGWHSLYTDGKNPSSYIVDESDCIYIKNESAGSSRYFAGEAIDLTPFTTFHARGYRTVQSHSSADIGVSNAYNFSSLTGHLTSTTINYSSTGTYANYSFDLSNYNSSQYLFFSASGTAKLYLSELWVE